MQYWQILPAPPPLTVTVPATSFFIPVTLRVPLPVDPIWTPSTHLNSTFQLYLKFLLQWTGQQVANANLGGPVRHQLERVYCLGL